MFVELASLGIDLAFFGVFYTLYNKCQNNFEELNNAPVLKIDPNLPKIFDEYKNGIIPYAIVQGAVLSNGPTLKSYYGFEATSVLQQVIVTEHKTKWSPWSRLWLDVENEIKRAYRKVPFSLVNGSWLKKTKVEIIDLPSFDSMPLTTVYDNFTPSTENVGNIFLSWAKGERFRGLREVEKILSEGTQLTAIGQLVLENNSIQMKRPKAFLRYYLTNLTPDEVMQELKGEVKVFKTLAVLFGCVGVALAVRAFLNWRAYRAMEIERRARASRLDEARKQRRRELAASGNAEPMDNLNQPQCVVCLSRPVEVVILRCGHACLCLTCEQEIGTNCPICREVIVETVPAFFP